MSDFDALPLDFRAFHQLHRPAYVRWAHTRLGNRADAEEAVDDAFEQLVRTWDTVLSKDNPHAWAWQVLRNRVADHARTRCRRATLAQRAFDTLALREAVDPIGQLEESMNLYAAIEALPARQLDVVVLHYLMNYSYQEIATHLGITTAGVRSTERNARRSLRAALQLTEGTHADDLPH
ncbi:sigma-70 family RNA polymerase sigma factor [Streptomyces sp. OF3]|uniref:Sigma-70 family RNA polymerase sigma factor n=1 Tax=Streptomyces alkaliterrae TaxID=2213162 RepID=A0A7W3WHQ8_9ACTN|nr:sigma-70 family RNA polymerase sigma factor [Streptomyces alkaliterrae]MBB1252539.1 sigma-70 family RNA polymerase sigma factor [Streptomyces alkaliterrae]